MSGTNQSVVKSFLPLLLVFVLASVIPVVFGAMLKKLNIEPAVLIAGNLILFAVAAISLMFYRKALQAGNTQVFLRNFYSGMMLKFFVCIIAALIYIVSAGKGVNRAGLFCVMGLYLVYNFIEIAMVLKQSRQIKLNRNA